MKYYTTEQLAKFTRNQLEELIKEKSNSDEELEETKEMLRTWIDCCNAYEDACNSWKETANQYKILYEQQLKANEKDKI